MTVAAPKLMFDLTGRVAVVTGASSGLGRRAATVLAAAGANVVGVARRVELLEKWSAKASGGETAVVPWDLTDRNGLVDLAEKVKEPFGAPDILVHAAGINTRQLAEEVTHKGWDVTMALNLSTPFFLSQALVPDMKEKGWGRIVTFSSKQSLRAVRGGVSYGASKAGVTQVTRSMAEAWSPYGINVNAIGPGVFDTELREATFADKNLAAQCASLTCIGRNGSVEDLDGPLLFLCSDASNYVTGQVLMVDGGMSAK
jgi:NAD(P)-dependent dehydrogenase (short-subunit alcohol dehydrogenase family)